MTGFTLGFLYAALGAAAALASVGHLGSRAALTAGQRRQCAAACAISYGAIACAACLFGIFQLADPMAGASAAAAWLWWINGGGDDVKRRLRSLAARFRPVRRTAPAVT